ncbi:MAG: glycosyltransferase family 2 protein [Eubacterium sp.]|nr:glycosyltransferase family 2 protein [Eubacterium sp.]
MPKVSILIPAYNVENYIEECLGSVLGQSLQDFEIICVDDCSTDKTPEILKEYTRTDKRITYARHVQNLGQSAARNRALMMAKGEYVYMLDADDRIVSGALQELYDICSADKLDVIGFETRNFSDDPAFEENVRIKTVSYDDTDILDGRDALTYCMEHESFSLSTPTFMMRREYLITNDILFTEGILHEDVGYIFELLTRADRVRFLHRILFERRIRANSTMTKGFTSKNIEGYLKNFYKSFEMENEMKDYFSEKPSFEKAYRKWQRDIFGRLNQLYVASADTISLEEGGNVNEEIRRAFEMVKLMHYRTAPLGIKECYLTGTGQYTGRAIEAVGAQGIIIRGIIVLEKTSEAFAGFPLLKAEEAGKNIPVVISVSKYSREEYEEALKSAGITELIQFDY